MSEPKMKKLAEGAKRASFDLATLAPGKKNAALVRIADAIERDASAILAGNAKDTAAAKKAGISSAMLSRLTLDANKIKKMADGIRQVASLPDPVGRLLERTDRPNGLSIEKISVPLGVLLIIFESRPNVTADCAALAIKSGNAAILKGGSEAIHSNRAIHAAIKRALAAEKIDPACVQLVDSTDRRDVDSLLKLSGLIDVVIPRGGETLIRRVAEVSRIPVIKHYKGVCHVYVDAEADIGMALKIAENAKVQNPGVCNAMETLLVHRDAAREFLPRFVQLMKKDGVELRGDAETRKLVKGVKPASEKDWGAEYLDLILSIRVVKDLDEAVKHIRKYGSQHSESIVTRDKNAMERFAAGLDSACIFLNASTRFNDGGEFGMGAEIGISTDKLHARGPMGLRELTTYKYVVRGNGQIRT